MPRVTEKKVTLHTKVTQLTKTHHTTTTTKTTTSGKKPASTPKQSAPPPRGILANKNSKPSTPKKPTQTASTKIVPARATHLQTMAMRPTKDGRSEWKLEVKGPTPGKTIVERGVAVRSGDKIVTALFREEHLNSGNKSSNRKAAGSSKKPSTGQRVTFQDTTQKKARG